MESFIARRLYKSEQGSRNVSRPAVFIAQLGVALGLAVMLVTIAVSFGFKHEVRDKAVGFSSHLHISNYESAQSYEALPVAADSALWHTLIRKGAHFSEYAILGALLCNAIRTYRFSRFWRWAIPIAGSAIYAMSDELHQFFVPDRVCSIVDVGIDTAGAICGTAVFALIAFLLRRRKKHIKTAQ